MEKLSEVDKRGIPQVNTPTLILPLEGESRVGSGQKNFPKAISRSFSSFVNLG